LHGNYQTCKPPNFQSIEPPNHPKVPAPPSHRVTHNLRCLCFVFDLFFASHSTWVVVDLWICRFGFSPTICIFWALNGRASRGDIMYRTQRPQRNVRKYFVCGCLWGLWHFLARRYACNLSTHEIFRCLPYLSTSCIICTFVLLIKDILDIFLVWPYLASDCECDCFVVCGVLGHAAIEQTRQQKKEKE